MRNKLFFRLLSVVFVISVILGFVLAGMTFEKQELLMVENQELKTQIHEITIHHTKDSVHIITKIVYDTIVLGVVESETPLIETTQTIQVYSNLLQCDSTLVLVDRLLWDIQSSTDEPVLIPMWKKTRPSNDARVLYYDDVHYSTAKLLKDSVSSYLNTVVAIERHYDKSEGLIELYLVNK